jgi:hypothetical protein
MLRVCCTAAGSTHPRLAAAGDYVCVCVVAFGVQVGVRRCVHGLGVAAGQTCVCAP